MTKFSELLRDYIDSREEQARAEAAEEFDWHRVTRGEWQASLLAQMDEFFDKLESGKTT